MAKVFLSVGKEEKQEGGWVRLPQSCGVLPSPGPVPKGCVILPSQQLLQAVSKAFGSHTGVVKGWAQLLRFLPTLYAHQSWSILLTS